MPPVRRRPAPPPGVEASPNDFHDVRLTADLAERVLASLAAGDHPSFDGWSSRGPNILALSGGGAGGAFGAGVLVGLGKAGARPAFDIVTGVSTGAMIAPMAFLGPAWDERLIEAYTGGHAERLLGLRALYRRDGLDLLVGGFVDDALLQAIAIEHAKGRLLFVATTNLDTQQNIVWDLGAVAAHGGEAARRLFHDVLVASASLPGLFPPKMIDVSSADGRFQEMHVDGGTSIPLFILPESLLLSRDVGRLLAGAKVYVIVNTRLEPAPHTTAANRLSILIRSLETMLHFSYRRAVDAVAAFCGGAGLELRVVSVPTDLEDAGILRFDTQGMRRVFQWASDFAESGRAWTSTP